MAFNESSKSEFNNDEIVETSSKRSKKEHLLSVDE